MDDLTRNCPWCHEVTRDPAHHTCGRTPEGTLPANQPHTASLPEPLDLSLAELDASCE